MRRHMFGAWVVLSVGLVGSLGTTRGTAADWPQWLGPGQAAHWEQEGLLDRFPAEGLQVKWRANAGLGYAGPAVADGRVYLFDYVRADGEVSNNPGARVALQGEERLQCLSSEDGSLLWQQSYSAPYNISYPSGPRATPTVDGERVYTLGAEGRLVCRAIADGSLQWEHDLKTKYGVESPIWGFSAAPLVDGDSLFVMVGGAGHTVVAFDKQTGKELWTALSAPDAGYAPTTIVSAGGKRQLIVWHPNAINGLDPESGHVYWSIDLKPDFGMSIMVPRHSGDYLFASGIGNVGAALKLSRSEPSAEIAWTGKSTTAVYCANSPPVIEDGIIYGCDCGSGALVAVKLETGERLWETQLPTVGSEGRKARHATAFLVKNGDRHVIFSETGDLILARLSAEKYEEISRMHLIDPTNECFGRQVVWSHPAFAGSSVFARNDREIVCVSLAK